MSAFEKTLDAILPASVEKKPWPVNMLECINGFTSICEILGKDPNADYHILDKLEMITDVLNMADSTQEAWTANWLDRNQTKYYPWFEAEEDASAPGGVRFAFSDCVGDGSCTGVGSRLCVGTPERAKFSGTHFNAEWNEFLRKSTK